MRCPGRGSPSEEGNVVVEGTTNLCATAEFATISASTPGEKISLHGEALDDDEGPDAPSFTWRLVSGVELGTGADLEADCSALEGSSSVVLEVSDGNCGDKYTLTIPPEACDEPSSGSMRIATASAAAGN
jgi:hypothetical protein